MKCSICEKEATSWSANVLERNNYKTGMHECKSVGGTYYCDDHYQPPMFLDVTSNPLLEQDEW